MAIFNLYCTIYKIFYLKTALVQPASGLEGGRWTHYPELRFACTGLSMYVSFGDGKNCQLKTVNCQPKTVNYQLSIIRMHPTQQITNPEISHQHRSECKN